MVFTTVQYTHKEQIRISVAIQIPLWSLQSKDLSFVFNSHRKRTFIVFNCFLMNVQMACEVRYDKAH